MKYIKIGFILSVCLLTLIISLFIFIKSKIITIVTTGDVVLARSVNFNSINKFHNFSWPFAKVKKLLNSSNVVLINLESPLIKNCQVTNKKVAEFCGDERHIEGLIQGGINVVNIANNHITDHGETGKNYTINLLKKSNILVSGVSSKSISKTIKGVRFAFLGFNDINCFKVFCEKESNIKTEIQKAKKSNDVVVVSFHWGDQYSSKPTEKQRLLGRLAIDSGADIVVGNHPHWIQPLEKYKSGVITYSLGNFVFDQQWSEETRKGIIYKYFFIDKKLIYIQPIPIYINIESQPEVVTE